MSTSPEEIVVTWDPAPTDPQRTRGASVLDGLFLGYVRNEGGARPWRACAKSDRETAHTTEELAMKACASRLCVLARERLHEQRERATLDARLEKIRQR